MKTPHPTSDPAGFPPESLTPPVDDGGAAFPILDRDAWGNVTARGGMSLREWFAGQALAAMGTWCPDPNVINLNSEAACKARAKLAFAQADAMLTARKGGARV